MTRRKVAVVAYSAPPHGAGGVASAHFNLFRLLQKSGLEARLFTFGENELRDEADIVRRGSPGWVVFVVQKTLGVLFAILQPGKACYQTADIAKSLIGAKRMSREIAAFSPDVIILSDHGAPGLALDKAEKTKVILVSHHNPARFLALPGANYSKLDAHLALSLEHRVFMKVDAVVCPSAYMREWFERSYKFSGVIKVIPNLLDEEALKAIPPMDLRSQFNMEPETVVVYLPSAGGMLKGADYLLALIRRLCAKSTQVIGFYVPGEIPPRLMEQAAGLPDQARLCFTGQLSYVEHIANVKACSFGISPSLIENYSMALLEAVCCGVPMLAFETGGNADIIHNGENGYLVAEGDVDALSVLAIELLETGTLKELRQKTTVFSRGHLSSRKALKAYLDLMDSL
jgi:glycosyltransferase involved in cell wall biosynthesis